MIYLIWVIGSLENWLIFVWTIFLKLINKITKGNKTSRNPLNQYWWNTISEIILNNVHQLILFRLYKQWFQVVVFKDINCKKELIKWCNSMDESKCLISIWIDVWSNIWIHFIIFVFKTITNSTIRNGNSICLVFKIFLLSISQIKQFDTLAFTVHLLR